MSRESSIVMLLMLAIAMCTARPHVVLQVPVAGSLSSPRERVQCLLACPVGLAGSKMAQAKNPMSCCRCHLQVRYRRRASVRVMSFGLPCWASREQAGKSKMQNWVWRGLAKFARRVPHARFCPGVRADSISETMLPGLNWWAYIILTV